MYYYGVTKKLQKRDFKKSQEYWSTQIFIDANFLWGDRTGEYEIHDWPSW
jgi:hypothetical protein